MNLKEELLKGIYAYGFKNPSAIQQRAIVPMIKGRDIIAQAQVKKKINNYSQFFFFEINLIQKKKKKKICICSFFFLHLNEFFYLNGAYEYNLQIEIKFDNCFFKKNVLSYFTSTIQ